MECGCEGYWDGLLGSSCVAFPVPFPFLYGLGEGSSYTAPFFDANEGDTDGHEGVIGRPQNV